MRALLACLAVLALAACAVIPEPAATGPSGPPLERFSADGRISLRQGARSDHLRFRWEHVPGRDVVLLVSPLGQGLAELTRDTGGARLVVPGRETVTAPTLRELTGRLFQNPLPLDVLADWLRGAVPDEAGEAEGWRLSVPETSPYGQRRLVRTMEAARGEVELRLVIDDWDIPE